MAQTPAPPPQPREQAEPDLKGASASAQPLIGQAELLRARLRAAPRSPGVYIFKDQRGRVIYVGKSASLRDRLRSYFTAVAAHPARTRRLVESAFDFEVVATGTEQQALILENTLIKRHHPRFNVRLRDDKNYLYFRIPKPTPGAATRSGVDPGLYPRPTFTRRLGDSGARYFGPYTDAKAIRRSVRELRSAVPFRGCSDPVFRRGRVCLDFHLGICAGPCEGLISAAGYERLLDDAAEFLSGHTASVSRRLESAMQRASEELDFELAASLRDRLTAVRKLSEEQVTSPRIGAAVDVVGLATNSSQGMAAVLKVRDGRVQGMDQHPLEGVQDLSKAEILSAFLGQFYGSAPTLPRAIVVPVEPEASEVLRTYLGERRGGAVSLRVPHRGRLRQLLARAGETAEAALAQSVVSQDFDRERGRAALEDLRVRLGLGRLPVRMECYDISNTMGQQSVGSMVVFEDGAPKVSDYRIFGIRTVEGPNDFASMEEVIERRFGHTQRGTDEADGSLGVVPDLVIVDGGAGQLAAAHRAMQRLGVDQIPHFGLAKRFEELHRIDSDQPLHLAQGSPALFLVQRIRDEAHRFAITRHRARRQKAGLRSRLDEVTGLGPKRKRALLQAFGSVAGIKDATVEELVAVPGVTRPVADAIKELL